MLYEGTLIDVILHFYCTLLFKIIYFFIDILMQTFWENVWI